jgi:Transcription elongation factor
MDIDLSVLRSLESEKDISLDQAIKAIEDALLVAYHKSEGASSSARVEVDRKSGHVTVWAIQTGPDGTAVREYDDTPAGFGRIAATTARQVILQRLRDVEDELTFGEYAGREGDIVAGVIQQGKDPGPCWSTWASWRRCCRPPSRCRASATSTASGSAATCCTSARATAGPRSPLSRTHPGLVKKLFALEVPEIAAGEVEIVAIAREAGHRTKIAVRSHRQGVNAKGPASARWAAGCGT